MSATAPSPRFDVMVTFLDDRPTRHLTTVSMPWNYRTFMVFDDGSGRLTYIDTAVVDNLSVATLVDA